MKIKVLIVDDEKLERVLIRKGFDWEKSGFEIIGEASGGERALEYLKRGEIPDIVLTDINMPGMDGLTLAEEILKIYSGCFIVIVTGYRDFDYARRALKIGVKDFILKPVDFTDIKNTVLSIKSEIEENRIFMDELSDLKAREFESRRIVLGNSFNNIINNKLSESETLTTLSDYSLNSLAKSCMCALISFNDNELISDTETVCDVMDFFERDGADLCIASNSGDIVVYFSGEKQGNIESILKNGCEFIESSTDYIYEYYLSDLCSGVQGIRDAYAQVNSLVKNEKNKKYNKITQKAINYINENLSDAELSLKTVASAVFVNESYLSRVFRQETGERLIEYITKKRIDLSKELLNTTDLKAYEIAEAVGINNAHYFSICFKKLVGMTVTEYKNG